VNQIGIGRFFNMFNMTIFYYISSVRAVRIIHLSAE